MQIPIIDVIIPAFNEEASVSLVINDIPRHLVRHVVVADNGSKDNTASVATDANAVVVTEPRKGYGSACLKGMTYLAQLEKKSDIVVFLDADYSDHPQEMESLIHPILNEGYDMVIGARVKEKREKGSMMPQQVFGNWLATRLMKTLYGYTYSDLGPFRAIRYDALLQIDMQDTNFGWTVEMQLKAGRLRLKTTEIPVSYRKRIGVSKVSGTIKGTIMAGYKIIATIFKYRK